MGVITLLTDFGTQDEYAGVLKGVILTINPSATVVDITHHIAPQGIDQAGEVLDAAFSYFPKETIHLAVVDPGVGTRRHIVAVRSQGHTFVAPDNGLLTPILAGGHLTRAVRVENERLYRQPVSATFHGRDIFAPVAAHLSMGMPMEELGPHVGGDHIVRRPYRRCEWTPKGDIVGEVVYIDRFGNIGTNIDRSSIRKLEEPSERGPLEITIGDRTISRLSESYSQSGAEELAALLNSRDRLEIAINGGNAAQWVSAQPGMVVRVIKTQNKKRSGSKFNDDVQKKK